MDGTFGDYYIGDDFFCKSLELPDLNFDGIIGDEKGQSCIPASKTYPCKRVFGKHVVANAYKNYSNPDIDPEVMEQLKNGETFEILGADCGETSEVKSCSRDSVLHHPANRIEDLKGCVGMGKDISIIEKKGFEPRKGITSSRDTFAAFMQEMKGINEFQLRVDYDSN